MLPCNKRRHRYERNKIRISRGRILHVFTTLCNQCNDEDMVWDFDHVERTCRINNDGTPQRETMVDMSHGAYDFLVDFVHMRPEKEIAVVGHTRHGLIAMMMMQV